MLLPKTFKETIAKTFYDKEVKLLSKTTTVDAEGGRTKAPNGATVDTFLGNVRYTNLKEIQEEYGLDYQMDIAITTDYETVVVDDLIEYGNVVYVIKDAIPSDSHRLLVANKYSG